MKKLLDRLACWWLDTSQSDIDFAKRMHREAMKIVSDAYEADEEPPWLGVYVTDYGDLQVMAIKAPVISGFARHIKDER